MDNRTHNERTRRDRSKITYRARPADLPDGAMIALPGHERRAALLHGGHLLVWSPAGYGGHVPLPDGDVDVLTPRSSVAVLEAGYRNGVEVSMCGEMSGDVAYTIPLVGLGLRTFSISPGTIPEVKKLTRAIALRDSAKVVERIFAFAEASETEAYLRELASRIMPELF